MSIKTMKQMPQLKPMPIFPILSILSAMVLIAYFISLPQAKPAANSFESDTFISTSGALTTYLNDADVSCQANTLSLNIPASDALHGYSIHFTSPVALAGLTHPTIIDSSSKLELHLINAEQQAYRKFTATSGEVFLNNNRGVISAFLTDENSQSLFLNASFACN